jgi:hypothetical protein
MIRPNIVSRSKIIVEQHFSLTEQRLKVPAKTLKQGESKERWTRYYRVSTCSTGINRFFNIPVSAATLPEITASFNSQWLHNSIKVQWQLSIAFTVLVLSTYLLSVPKLIAFFANVPSPRWAQSLRQTLHTVEH